MLQRTSVTLATQEYPIMRIRTLWIFILLLTGGALWLRVTQLADFLTTDEGYHWIERVERFTMALERGNWFGTSQTGHPGVTNMWLGALGLQLERLAYAAGWPTSTSRVEYLAWLRLPHAVLEALSLPLVFALLLRLFRPGLAVLATFLWAVSPYLIAHSRLLHLDGLLTLFVSLSVLALLVAVQETNRQPPASRPSRFVAPVPLVASAICAGLALLTKGPALILLPWIGLAMFVFGWLFVRSQAKQPAWVTFGQTIQLVVPHYLLWLLLALATVFLLWPALWADAPRALANYVDEIRSNGGRPNGDGQFFLGQVVGDPGWWFYPVTNLLRSTPLLLLGWVLVFLALALQWRTHAHERRTLLAVGAFVLFWTLVMTLGPKKFDRYVLPTWPALCILGAVGLWFAWQWLRRHALTRWRQRATVILAGSVLLVEVAQPLLVRPYYLSYYNPLFGGGATAQQVVLIGWGEGMDQVGAYLRSRPDAAGGQVLSALPELLRPFVEVPVRDVDTLADGGANYAIVYLESVQRGANPAIYATIRETLPLKTITINGIDYAHIHQLPRMFRVPVGATFAESLRLRGVTVEQAPGQIIVTPAWDVRARPNADLLLFVHLFNAQGERVGRVDVAPGGGADAQTSTWEIGRQVAVPIGVPVPADLATGEYQVVLGLYDPQTNQRLAVVGGQAADPALAGPHALQVATFAVR
jgi:4-amino-4-deoxy-L-arabinose transferase-like glycosyltransferase